MIKGKKARELVERFPNLSKKKLGELLFKENQLLFKDAEDARWFIKNVTNGKRSYMKTDKYIGVLPEGEKNDFSPFVLNGKRIGILSDIHIPYHDLDALHLALTEFKKVNVDTILLNGDIIDCYNLSNFEKDPNKRNHNHEVTLLTVFLDDLINMFPNVEIVYRTGNHENRYERFLNQKSPELLGMHIMSWKHLINLRFENCQSCQGTGILNGTDCPNCDKGTVANQVSRGIHFINGKRIIKAGKLNILHYHELYGGVSGVNPARSAFLKTNANVIGGHIHRTSEFIQSNLNGEITGAWTIGCLCELHPEYAPINFWNSGFAWIDVAPSGGFEVHNHKIIDGKVK